MKRTTQRKQRYQASKIAEEKLKQKELRKLRKAEIEKERKCANPKCSNTFTWENGHDGKKYCSYSCCLKDPNRLTGRKPIVDDEILSKLRYAFMIGCTDEEACDFAGISYNTFYNYQKEHPEFKEEKVALRRTRILMAKEKVFENISNDTELAKWNLERLKKKEYGPKNFFEGEIFNGEIDEEHKKIARRLLKGLAPEEKDASQKQ